MSAKAHEGLKKPALTCLIVLFWVKSVDDYGAQWEKWLQKMPNPYKDALRDKWGVK